MSISTKIILTFEFFLAGKFLTRRVLNINIIGRMLKPIWKACRGFEICTIGNHVILFVFDIDNVMPRTQKSSKYEKYIPRYL